MRRLFGAGTAIRDTDRVRWRSREVSRIEGLSDAVFGFAITLLVVSLEVPRTSGEIIEAMRGFVAFGLTFSVLISIWHTQYLFFRRYGLDDDRTFWLNACLLFVVLLFTYPLKFLFTVVVAKTLGMSTDVRQADGSTVPAILPQHEELLWLMYGLGFIGVFALFTLMYSHARAQKEMLQLTDNEVFETEESIRRWRSVMLIGFIAGSLQAINAIEDRWPVFEQVSMVLAVAALAVLVWVLWSMSQTEQRRRLFEASRRAPQRSDATGVD
jgi:uncharacterized membrane protein